MSPMQMIGNYQTAATLYEVAMTLRMPLLSHVPETRQMMRSRITVSSI